MKRNDALLPSRQKSAFAIRKAMWDKHPALRAKCPAGMAPMAMERIGYVLHTDDETVMTCRGDTQDKCRT